jgi:hypothetical protein
VDHRCGVIRSPLGNFRTAGESWPFLFAEIRRASSPLVMPALVAGIHVFASTLQNKTWMAGTNPAMTTSNRLFV